MNRRNAYERKERLRQWVERVSSAPQQSQQAPELSSALADLQTEEPVSKDQAETLEAIVVSYAPPAVPVGDGSVFFEPPWSHLSEGPTQDLLKVACAAVGQLESSATEVPGYAGTAFLVSHDLIMTTRNVAESFATGIGVHSLGFKPGRQCQIDFGNGGDEDASQAYPITAVAMIHPYLDIAVLRLAAEVPIAPLELWAEDPGAFEGRDIAVIAYPQFDLRYGVELQKSVLAAAPGVKRVMPGRVMEPRLQSTLGRQMLALTDDSTTLGGRAGGPVVDLATGRVVGVSFASTYLDANFAVPISELARDIRLWEAGLKFVGASKPSDSPWQEYWSEADPSEDTPAAVEQIATPTFVPWVQSAIELLVTEHFSDASRFRQFLTKHDYPEVVRAIPEGADSSELLRALERRGLLDEAFLRALTTTVPNAPNAAGPAGISPWLPQSMLSRVAWALEPIDAETMAIYTIGSPWRDYVLGEDGNPEAASATVQRLAYDRRPEINQVLAWLLRRLYESADINDQERVNALYEAVQHLEGGQKETASDGQVAPEMWSSSPAAQTIGYLEEGLRAARSVALVRLSREPGAAAYGSTCWLLTPDLVVVPAHLLSTYDGPVMDFSIELANKRAQSAIIQFDFDAAGQQTIEYRVRDVVMSDPYFDIAVLRLADAVKDRAPLAVRPNALPKNLSGLAAIHHPHLGPKQISRDGRLLRSQANDVLYLIDTAPGSAGAPIFDEQWRVIAVHRAYSAHRLAPDQPAIRAKLGTSAAALLSRLRDREGYEDIWRQVVAAQSALKSVNINPAHFKETANMPVVLRLLDDEPFKPVPGFHITSQGGDVVTGLCVGFGLKALTEHPKVLAIDLSKPAGELECAISIPHIGAPVIHDAPYGEKGDKALIALIDSGIDVRHRAFCDDQGKTRILAFWDQQDARSPAGKTSTLAAAESPEGEAWVNQFQLGYGALYVAEDIDSFLNGNSLPATFPPSAEMAHGTVVAGIAAGRKTGDTEDHFAGGVAPAAKLVVVRYDLQDSSVGYSKGHIDAINFIAGVAEAQQLPVVVNISNGMNAGAHDGTSPVEHVCNGFTDQGKAPGRIIVKSAGNERKLGHHAMIPVSQSVTTYLRWRSQNWPGRPPSTSTEEFEIWFHHLNLYRFELQPPRGSVCPQSNRNIQNWRNICRMVITCPHY